MSYFANLADYIATITARFNKPRRDLTNEGIRKADLIDAFSDAGKRAEDVRMEANALNANFVTRSLNLSSTIYVDGTNGNDARTGETNNSNATTGWVKTLARAVALHSGKTNTLYIKIYGLVEISTDVTMECNCVNIEIMSGAVLRMKKRVGVTDPGTNFVGQGNYRLYVRGTFLNIYVAAGGTLNSEAHTGSSGIGDQFYYRIAQGAVGIVNQYASMITTNEYQSITLRNGGTVDIGDNSTLFVSGTAGTNLYGSQKAIYWRYGSVTLGSNATESALIGDRTFLRQYNPISSTDANVREGETVLSSTGKIWTKRGGLVKDAMGTTFV